LRRFAWLALLVLAEAVRVHRDVGARQSLGIHWGTFYGLTDESLYEPPQRLAQAR
jgi:N-acyl-phosphatidylethanolamine-hydrolysing phospholipase D